MRVPLFFSDVIICVMKLFSVDSRTIELDRRTLLVRIEHSLSDGGCSVKSVMD